MALSFLSMLLMKLEATADIGAVLLVAMPCVLGISNVRSRNGADAMLTTLMSAAISSEVACAVVFGPKEFGGIVFLWAPMLVSAVVGVVLGMIQRRIFRRRLDRGDTPS